MIQKTIMTKTCGKILTRSQANFPKKVTTKDMTKRKADQLSPPKGKTTKRTALNESTNFASKQNVMDTKKTIMKKPILTSSTNLKVKEIGKLVSNVHSKIAVYVDPKSVLTVKTGAQNKENIDPVGKKNTKVLAHIESAEVKISELKITSVQTKEKCVSNEKTVSVKSERSTDGQQDKSEESLYTTALEDVTPDSHESSRIISPIKRNNEKSFKRVEDKKSTTETGSPKVPAGVEDFDKENILDPIQVSEYAMDIFEYMKRREKAFVVKDYMTLQPVITKWMRSLLVDWMVDVQENFELNHETLYLGVKITDLYLSHVVVAKENLQLVGAAALFLASKYEERMPPLIEDFIYICENAFERDDLIKMELNVFKVIDYSLGIPLSYRFLRRFSRCCKASMPTLTLARYILELSLMEYHMIFHSESKIACAALYMALRMKNISGWTPTLEFYSGYKLSDFMPIVLSLNSMLHQKPKEQLKIIKNKYSHKIFFEVAKTPLLDDKTLETTKPSKETIEKKPAGK
ncbi:G2/mitotic-specific cyclin-B3, putative [Pediculus humanus corporis]|uniref:G2/mitotic-specific cyclin-B3, putative n=1 Tax=Pediculus humanus subsp. corporis TaxID=121224 RepID=E0VTL6_PEDHC|nr:G2/mitotic-specific cyclin-B3, putative [Pediculus humanus corporis]EEB16691.1 G2/mitotic-specific cyclin-B3, putative [Pediculus humanus corporis]